MDNQVLSHPTWARSYTLRPTVAGEVSLTFSDGQRIFFDPTKVLWSEVTRTVATWERMIGDAA